jgi:dTDP-4-dehydrorhamnose 3,5-epimerase
VRFLQLSLAGAYVIEPDRLGDGRGFFARTWCKRMSAAIGHTAEWVQHSVASNRAKGTLRGMHYQAPPQEEVKLIQCVSGEIYDVILDLRLGSPTYGQWEAVELSAANLRLLYVPKGLAHGYQTLVDDTTVHYLISEEYRPEAARGVRYHDPAFEIDWPLPVSAISERDLAWPASGAERL